MCHKFEKSFRLPTIHLFIESPFSGDGRHIELSTFLPYNYCFIVYTFRERNVRKISLGFTIPYQPTTCLLVQPILGMGLPIQKLVFFEPQSNLPLRRLHRVRSMADIASNFDAKITTNSTGCRFQWIRCSQHFASRRNGFTSFPHHAHDRPRQHVISEFREEWLLTKENAFFMEGGNKYIWLMRSFLEYKSVHSRSQRLRTFSTRSL